MLTTPANVSLSFPLSGGKAVEKRNDCNSASNRVAQLTRGLAAGDEGAFREFHVQYFDRLYRFLLATVHGAEQEAEEALQQTFIRLIRYIRVFESEEVFWGWLKAVARSAARDGNRKQRRYAAVLQRFALYFSTVQSIAPAEHEDRLAVLLEDGLTQLEPEDRHLVEAKYIDGFTVKEISALIGITERAVESRLDRLRRTLRSRLLKKLSRENE